MSDAQLIRHVLRGRQFTAPHPERETSLLESAQVTEKRSQS